MAHFYFLFHVCHAAALVLWIIFIYFSYLTCFLVCSLQPCGHLLGKGLHPGSLVCEVFLCFVTFPCGVLRQVWYLIVSIPEVSLLTYFVHYNFLKLHYSSHRIRYILTL